MDHCGKEEELRSRQHIHDKVWRNFTAGRHEELVECLEVLGYKVKLQGTRSTYQEKLARKLAFDTKMESWKSDTVKREQMVKSPSRKSSRRASSSRSLSWALTKKNEELALAQLKKKNNCRKNSH